MKETLLATYERESTLWKNANMFYKAQDWVKMECFFVDLSDNRNSGTRLLDPETGKDITASVWADRYEIVLTNKRGNNTKSFRFTTRDEANEAFLGIFNHKNLPGWKKVR